MGNRGGRAQPEPRHGMFLGQFIPTGRTRFVGLLCPAARAAAPGGGFVAEHLRPGHEAGRSGARGRVAASLFRYW